MRRWGAATLAQLHVIRSATIPSHRRARRELLIGIIAVAFLGVGSGLMAWLQPNPNPGDAPYVRTDQGQLDAKRAKKAGLQMALSCYDASVNERQVQLRSGSQCACVALDIVLVQSRDLTRPRPRA